MPRSTVPALVLSAVLAGIAASPARASAQLSDPTRRTPIATHAASSLAGSIVTFGSGIQLYFFAPPPTIEQTIGTRFWRGGILFDEAVRDAMRARDVAPQELARTISDITLFAAILNAAVIDALLVPLVQDDPDLAWQASMAHALALGLTLSVGEVIKRTAGRARPYERECQDEPGRVGCQDVDAYQSFYSLHSGVAFTSAGVSCALHLHRSLYDDPAADATACTSALALAATTGALRVVSDRHYLSDVLIGGLLGFVVGYLVPLAIVPERGAAHEGHDRSDTTTWAVAPLLAPAGPGQSVGSGTLGLSVFGAF